MKRHLAVFALLAAAACGSRANVIGTVDSPEGQIDLLDEQGPCVGDALRAVFVPSNPAKGEPISGCWVTGGPVVMVVFFDADVARIPAKAIMPPKGI